MPWYTIKSRDCLSAIALKAGLKDADALYDQPDNSDLRDKRPDPNVVFPGDQVFIPDLAVKEESADTDSRHTFRRSRPPRKCRVRILDVLGNAYADESYVLKVGSDRRTGSSTDGDGWLEEPVPHNIRSAKLEIAREELVLSFSAISPITTVWGIQERLNNLCFPCGRPDGKFGPMTHSALASFQRASAVTDELEVEEFGQPEENTLIQLSLKHDGVEGSVEAELEGEWSYEPESVDANSLADPDEDSSANEEEDADEDWEPDVETDRETVF